METLHPGVYTLEEKGVRKVIGVGVTTGGFVGIAKKGPLDRAKLITSFSEFVKYYGSYYGGSYLPHAVRAFFSEGGRRCWIARVAGTGSAKADKDFNGYEAGATIEVKAANEGEWGNWLVIKTQKVATITTAEIPSNATSVTLASVRGIEKGDLLVIDDGTTAIQVYVVSVNVSTKTVTFKDVGTITTISSSASVSCSTVHRVSTTLSKDLENGATEAELTSARNVVKGSRMYFDDGTNSGTVVVNNVSGNKIFFDAITLAGTLAAGTMAVSEEFNIEIYELGSLVEKHEYLSMEPGNGRDYIGNRLAGESNQSDYIALTDKASAPSDPVKRIPEPDSGTGLEDGVDGSTPGDDDYKGSSDPKSGIHLFDEIDDVSMISIPGITTIVVSSYGINYCETRGDCIFVCETPLADNIPLEAEEYRMRELNVDSSFGVLYYPWLIVPDPEQSGQRLELPPSGWLQGQWAEVARLRGVHKAPANVTLTGVLDLTWHITDSEQDILNPIGVNCIRAFPGTGIRVWGSRTLFSMQDGRHLVNVRRLLNLVKESVVDMARDLVFEPNDPALWTMVQTTIGAFLRSLWRRGMLYPSTDMSRAFFVKCDEETNPESEVKAGRVHIEIGINPSYPAEFFVLHITLWDGGVAAEEVVGML